ncbi:hypothetical protein [Bradyrhizobium sp. Tv2a-2]|uniref:hypothetical protein n=1 Tax=Bradyrhizobium sp. Tv2a-2 TaxID=113395 RepID=UPI0003FA1093|nr:hypothetical protein [Bradyrhizobium sp. Tv2a-2]
MRKTYFHTHVYTFPDDEVIILANAAGTDIAGAAQISLLSSSFKTTTFVVSRVDNNNRCVVLTMAPNIGAEVELHPVGGEITVFFELGAFFDGRASFTTTSAVRLKYLPLPQGGFSWSLFA